MELSQKLGKTFSNHVQILKRKKNNLIFQKINNNNFKFFNFIINMLMFLKNKFIKYAVVYFIKFLSFKIFIYFC